MLSSTQIFEAVAARKISPQLGADALMENAPAPDQRPAWMPRFIYVVGVILVAILFAPILSSRGGRRT